jgi:hypothetical protein
VNARTAPAALAKLREIGERLGVRHPVNLTVGVSDQSKLCVGVEGSIRTLPWPGFRLVLGAVLNPDRID